VLRARHAWRARHLLCHAASARDLHAGHRGCEGRTERKRVASATRDEALGALTDQATTRSRSVSRTFFLGPLEFSVSSRRGRRADATALPHPARHARGALDVVRLAVDARPRERTTAETAGARVPPRRSRLEAARRGSTDPDPDPVRSPSNDATARVRRAARAADLRTAAGGAGPASDRGRPAPPVRAETGARAPSPGFRPGEAGDASGSTAVRACVPAGPGRGATAREAGAEPRAPDPPGWLPPEETSDARERDGVPEDAETAAEEEGGGEWHPRGFPGVD
jgi:hypothetical protein